MHCSRKQRAVLVTSAVAVLLLWMSLSLNKVTASVRLKDICTVYGQREVKLTGMGLVMGLKGTGDGGNNLPAIRALAAAMKLKNTPVLNFKELKDADNFALVWIEATIPRHGARRGQKIDCYVTSAMGAKSLRGGRLMSSPLETIDIKDDTTRGLASGAIVIEDSKNDLVGRIPGGVMLTDDFVRDFIDVQRGNIITLLLDASHASFQAVSEVVAAVNDDFDLSIGSSVAKAVRAGVIEVTLPNQYHDSPVEFVAEVLDVRIENTNTQARVVVNNKTGVVIITGEVQISPVSIAHKNLVVEVNDRQPRSGPFVAVEQMRQGQPLTNANQQSQLKQLVFALNQLKVPNEDVIGIIRALHRSGALHAQYDER